MNDNTDKGLGAKLDDEEKETINTGVEETIEWLDENGEVSTKINFLIFQNFDDRFFNFLVSNYKNISISVKFQILL